MVHACSVTLTTACSVERFSDFQIVLIPVLVLRHRMSDTLSPLKTLVHVKSPETGETVARNVEMIGIARFRLRPFSDWFATPVPRDTTSVGRCRSGSERDVLGGLRIIHK